MHVGLNGYLFCNSIPHVELLLQDLSDEDLIDVERGQLLHLLLNLLDRHDRLSFLLNRGGDLLDGVLFEQFQAVFLSLLP